MLIGIFSSLFLVSIFFLGLVRIALASTLAVYERTSRSLCFENLLLGWVVFLGFGLQYWFIGLSTPRSHALYKRLLFL